MTVLVTGGTGFLGSHLLEMLVDEGEDIRVLALRHEDTVWVERLGIEVVIGDVLDARSLDIALRDVGFIYHLANVWKGVPKKTYHKINVVGTEKVLRAAIAHNVEKVVHTSSGTTIGAKRGELGTESSDHRGYFLTAYDESKYRGERKALEMAGRGLPLVVVNPSAVYGPGDEKSWTRLIKAAVNRKLPVLFESAMKFNLVYVEDIARGHILAMKKGNVGERYILSGENILIEELFRTIKNVSGVSLPKIKIPSWTLGMLPPFFFLNAVLTGTIPSVTSSTIKKLNHGWMFDNTKSKKDLGVEYTSLEDGIARTIEWLDEDDQKK